MSENGKPGEVVVLSPPAGGFDLANLSTDAAMEAAVKHFENAMEFKARALKLAVRTAGRGAIISMRSKDENGNWIEKPYFSESECERVLSFLGGATSEILSVTRETLEDGHWGVQVLARITHKAFGSFDGLGYASTKDQFLGANLDPKTDYKTGQIVTDDDGNVVPKRAIGDVSEHNLRQHAFTRAKGSAIRKMLGLNSLSKEDVSAMGFEMGKGGTVTYSKGGPKPAPKPPRTPKAETPKPPEADRASMLRDEIKGLVARKLVTVDEVAAWAKEIGVTGYVQDCADVDMLATLLKTCEAAIEGKKE